MVHNILVVAGKEFNRLRKSFFFWAGLILISIAPELINNPIQDGRVLCTARSVAYYVFYTAFITDTIAITLLIGYICFYDNKMEMDSVILTQPINTKCYALGRFLAAFCMWLFLALIRVVILLFIPLYFGAMPYSPIPFLEGTLIYLLPVMFYFTALTYLILMLSKSAIITIIISMFWGFAQMAVLHNSIIDVNLEDKVQAFAYEESLTSTFRNYYITNRISLILLGAVLLIIAVLVYSPNKRRITNKSKHMVSRLKLNYNFRIQPAIIRTAIVVIGIVCIFSTIIATDTENWYTIKIFSVMIPLFMISNVISEEYVNEREGILFTCKTPIYKQMLIRMIYAWIFSEFMLFICYLTAFFKGYESDFSRFIALLVISTFLSIIGLTSSNFSKRPLLGFIVPLAYYMFFALQGAMFNEKFEVISVINIILTSQILWGNILSLALITAILIVINVWYVGKGEKIRKPLSIVTTFTVIIGVTAVGIYAYNNYSKAILPSKILNSKDTVYILDSENVNAESFLKKKGVKYFHDTDIKADDISKNNVVVVADSNYKNALNETNFINKINLDDDGLNVNYFNIVDTSGFRVTTLNPTNNKKYMILMESKDWNEKELNLLFDEKEGSFIAEKEGVCLAKSNYNLESYNDMVDNLKLYNDKAWLMKRKEDVRILYRDIPQAKVSVSDLLDTWYIAHKEISNMVEDNIPNTIQVYFRGKPKEGLNQNAIKLELNDRRLLDPPKLSEERFMESISSVALQSIVTKNIEDEDIRTEWSNYLFRTKMVPAFRSLDKEILDYNYKTTGGDIDAFYGDYYKSIEEEINRVAKNIYSDRSNIGIAAKNILYSVDDKNKSLNKAIEEIYKSDNSIDESDLKEIFTKHYGSEKAENVFQFYDEVKEACEKYGGLGLMLKPVS